MAPSVAAPLKLARLSPPNLEGGAQPGLGIASRKHNHMIGPTRLIMWLCFLEAFPDPRPPGLDPAPPTRGTSWLPHLSTQMTTLGEAIALYFRSQPSRLADAVGQSRLPYSFLLCGWGVGFEVCMAIEIAPQTPQRLETLVSGRGLAVCIAVEILTEPSGYLKAVWPDLLGCLFEVWPAPGAWENLPKCGGQGSHILGGFPRPPGPARPPKRTPKNPARHPSGTQALTSRSIPVAFGSGMCRPCRPRCSDGMGRFPVGLRASSFRKPIGRSGLQNEPSLSPRCPIGLLLSSCGHILFAPCRRTSSSGSDPAFGETNSSCGVSSVSPWPEMQDSMIGIVQMLGSSHH